MEAAERILEGFDGILQVDGYQGYHRLARPKRKGGVPLRLAACWSHSRRKIIAATPKAGSPIAEAVLARIAALYAIEKEIRGADAPARQTRPVTSDHGRSSLNSRGFCASKPLACRRAARWARRSPIS
ncbi:IS66 family transposase [Bradyrhizobium diazoefficiens]